MLSLRPSTNAIANINASANAIANTSALSSLMELPYWHTDILTVPTKGANFVSYEYHWRLDLLESRFQIGIGQLSVWSSHCDDRFMC